MSAYSHLVIMTPATVTKRSLSTAEERREAVLTAAMQVFGERGFRPLAKIRLKIGGIGWLVIDFTSFLGGYEHDGESQPGRT